MHGGEILMANLTSRSKHKIRKYMRGQLPASEILHLKTVLLNESNSEKLETEPLEIRLLQIGKFENSVSSYYSIIKTILQTRGLTRFICFHFLSEHNAEYNISYQINRYHLIKKLIKDRRLVKDFIQTSIRFENIPNYSSKNYNHLRLWNYVNLDATLNCNLSRTTILWREYATEKLYRRRFGSLRSRSLLENLFLWNMKYAVNLIHDFNLVNEIQNELDRFSPVLTEMLQNKKVLSIKYIDGFAQTYDERLSNKCDKENIPVINNAELWHQRFIVKDDVLYFYDAATSLELPFVAGHWQYLEQKSRQNDVAILEAPSTDIRFVEVGILLSGRADENWFHFLQDSLPRLCFLDDLSADIPLVVRNNIPETSIAFLRSITDRTLILVSPHETLHIGTLYFLPARSTVLDSLAKEVSLARVAFSPVVLENLRNRIAGKRSNSTSSVTGPEILFDRRTKYRTVLNMRAIQKLATWFGFQALIPDDSFYAIQDTVFRNARTVMAPGGALFANILFMQKGSNVVCLHSWRGKDLSLWRKLCETMGVNYYEVNGIPTYFGPNKLQREHSNFYIPKRRLSKILEALKA